MNETKRSPAGWIRKLGRALSGEAQDRQDLVEQLREARERGLIDTEALDMLEGVLGVADIQVRDIMVPRSQMVVIDIAEPMSQLLPHVIRSAHSRFPVVEGELDNVIGILHAKDLLRLYAEHPPPLRELMRAAVFIPESKRLNVLLRDFRADRHHIAIVVDEYGGVAGLITIEDVLEQIVGDIEDEFDFDEQADHILPAEPGEHGPRFRVRAAAEIDSFNRSFGTRFPHEDFDTIGGLVTEHFGRVPRRGDAAVLDGLRFEVLRADARQVHLLMVERLTPAGQADGTRPMAG